MHTSRGIVRSTNPDTVALCEEIGRQIGMIMTTKQDVASFLLDLQENNYHVAIFDLDQGEPDSVRWVKFIRRLRPKLPLIVLCDEIDKQAKTQMYEEGIFYLGLRPLNREILVSVFKAAVKQSR